MQGKGNSLANSLTKEYLLWTLLTNAAQGDRNTLTMALTVILRGNPSPKASYAFGSGGMAESGWQQYPHEALTISLQRGSVLRTHPSNTAGKRTAIPKQRHPRSSSK